jgi:hypothetical protein
VEDLLETARRSNQGELKLLLEQIKKLNCDSCKLRTEHYLLSNEDGTLVLCRCLRCGRTYKDAKFVIERPEHSYPTDESRPIYVM